MSDVEERLRKDVKELKDKIKSYDFSWNIAIETLKTTRAENAELKEHCRLMTERAVLAEEDNERLRAELEAEVARLKAATYNPHTAQLKLLYPDQCRAITEAALRWAWEWGVDGTGCPMSEDEWVNGGLAALLGEK